MSTVSSRAAGVFSGSLVRESPCYITDVHFAGWRKLYGPVYVDHTCDYDVLGVDSRLYEAALNDLVELAPSRFWLVLPLCVNAAGELTDEVDVSVFLEGLLSGGGKRARSLGVLSMLFFASGAIKGCMCSDADLGLLFDGFKSGFSRAGMSGLALVCAESSFVMPGFSVEFRDGFAGVFACILDALTDGMLGKFASGRRFQDVVQSFGLGVLPERVLAGVLQGVERHFLRVVIDCDLRKEMTDLCGERGQFSRLKRNCSIIDFRSKWAPLMEFSVHNGSGVFSDYAQNPIFVWLLGRLSTAGFDPEAASLALMNLYVSWDGSIADLAATVEAALG